MSTPDGSSGEVRLLRLANGGTLGYREYGDPRGEPLIFLHGWPSSSGQGVMVHSAAQQHGLRVIALDRPGLGQSSRIPERTLLHIPPLVEELAESLGLEKCYLLGVSGGGPYALACAWALPHRVRKTVVCCGAPPLDTPEARQRFWFVYRALLAVHNLSPAAFQALLAPATLAARVRPPWALTRLALMLTSRRDREALGKRERFEVVYPAFRDAMCSGWRGVYDDGRCYAQPWPFDPAEIRVPVSVWHGTQDHNFHYSLAEQLTARIPGAKFHLCEEGHYSLPVFHAEDLVKDLLADTVAD
jgi:pimeloyl-ACP methyl ester carboxylesterase